MYIKKETRFDQKRPPNTRPIRQRKEVMKHKAGYQGTWLFFSVGGRLSPLDDISVWLILLALACSLRSSSLSIERRFDIIGVVVLSPFRNWRAAVLAPTKTPRHNRYEVTGNTHPRCLFLEVNKTILGGGNQTRVIFHPWCR